MNKFRPQSPDPFIIEDQDQALAKFGHINAIVDELNGVIPATTGLMYQSQYDPLNTGVVTNSYQLNGKPPSYYLDRTNHTGQQSQSTITGLVADLSLKGDMFRAVYDTDNDGIVDNSERLGSQLPSYYTNRANHTGTQAQTTITNLVADLAAKVDDTDIGVTVAPLVAGLVPIANLPFGAPLYQGLYDASTNTPAILNGVGVAGQFYIANVTGNAYAPVNVTLVNQIVAYNGAIWEVGAVFTGSIADVNGQTGPVVTLTLDDIPDTATRAAVDPNHNDALIASTYALNAGNAVLSQQDLVDINLDLSLKGDMFKATYDSDNDGVVDNSERLGGQVPAFYTSRANHTGTQSQATITNLITDLSSKIPYSEKGANNGVCDLDINGKVPAARLNISALNYQNSWNVQANSPSLADGIGNIGDTYIVGYAGPTPPFVRNLGVGGPISWSVGDLAVYNGSVWQRVPVTTGGIISVNGITTPVLTLNADDVPEGPSVHFYLTFNQNAAADAANAPTGANPFATIADLTPIETDVTTIQGQITTINTTLTGKENKSEKGVANGYVPLNAGGKIDNSYLNFSPFAYQNSWDASVAPFGSPALQNGIGTSGQAYIVGTAGTINHGAGPVTYVVGDLVIYNGTVWQKISGAPAGVSSVNGFTGAVTLTADNVSETATRFYVNSNQNAALDAAVSASGANRFATLSDLAALGTVYYVTPDEFANGHTIGDGTTRTLSSLGYTNISAAAVWTQVAADSRFTINVASMTIDWIALQTAILTMEQTRRTCFFSPGGTRTYNVNQSLLLPRTNAVTNARFYMYFSAAIIQNVSGTNFVVCDRFPLAPNNNLTTANAWTAFPLFIYDLTVGGNGDNTDTSNIGIRIASNIHGGYYNVISANSAVNMVLYFNINVDIVNCQFIGHGLYGLIETNANFGVCFGPAGQQGWTGGTNTNSQCNKIRCKGNRFLPGNTGTIISAHYIYGGYSHIVMDQQTENMNNTMQHMLYYEGAGDQVENPLTVINFDYEINGTISRAGIRARTEKGVIKISSVHGFVLGGMDATIEGDNRAGTGLVTIILRDTWQGAGHILRDVCNSGGACFQYSVMWDIAEFGIANPFDPFDAANWDTGVANSQIPYYQKIRYNGVFVDANQQQSTDTWDYPRITAVYAAGTPTAQNKIPQFIGQMYYDTANNKAYIGKGTTLNTDWTILN